MALYPQALLRILPSGESAYLALLTKGPEIDGTHEEEADYLGYARVEHVSWATHQDLDGAWYVSNTGSIVFPAVTGSALYVYSWGVYLNPSGGDLIASGPVLNAMGWEQPQFLWVGDQARFLDGSLKIRSGS